MLHLRKQQDRSLRQDVGRAGTHIADESRGLAQAARDELSHLGEEVRGQAVEKTDQARKAAASRLAGAADALEPDRKRRRKLPWLVTALAGGIAALKLTKRPRQAPSSS